MLHAPIRTALAFLALTAPLALTASCSTTKGATATGLTEVTSEWVQPTDSDQRKINVRAMEVSVINSTEAYVELSDWFQSKGEQVYPKLLEMVETGDTRQRSFSLSVISALRDARLAEPLHDAMPESALKSKGHGYEYARALAAMGDYSMLPVLIEGLQDDDQYTRALANDTLQKATRNAIPFNANATPDERQIAVDAWMLWWERQQTDELLSVSRR